MVIGSNDWRGGPPTAAERGIGARAATVRVLSLAVSADGGSGHLQTVERAPFQSRTAELAFRRVGAGASSGRLSTGPCAAWMCQPQSSCYEASLTTRTVREMSETASRATFNEPVQNEQRRAGDSRRPPVRRSGGGSSPAHLGGAHWVPLGAATRRGRVGPQLCAPLTNLCRFISVRAAPTLPLCCCHIACG